MLCSLEPSLQIPEYSSLSSWFSNLCHETVDKVALVALDLTTQTQMHTVVNFAFCMPPSSVPSIVKRKFGSFPGYVTFLSRESFWFDCTSVFYPHSRDNGTCQTLSTTRNAVEWGVVIQPVYCYMFCFSQLPRERSFLCYIGYCLFLSVLQQPLVRYIMGLVVLQTCVLIQKNQCQWDCKLLILQSIWNTSWKMVYTQMCKQNRLTYVHTNSTSSFKALDGFKLKRLIYCFESLWHMVCRELLWEEGMSNRWDLDWPFH